jgi:hypothetical protein
MRGDADCRPLDFEDLRIFVAHPHYPRRAGQSRTAVAYARAKAFSVTVLRNIEFHNRK